MEMVLFLLLLAQPQECDADANALMKEASARLQSFDSAGAAEALSKASALGCGDAAVALSYLKGLAAATDAYAVGGSPESLQAVSEAISSLERMSVQSVPAAIARFVLLAAAAASQSEREEMALFLAEALRIEGLQLMARQPGAPVVTAHEIAGDLWLRVHRYDQARQAYLDAFKMLGPTLRTALGLARSAARLDDVVTACLEYRTLVDRWDARAPVAEIVEARDYLTRSPCRLRG